ncbi:MAG: TonB-dependent receptor [Sphingobacteriales bacterium]|jgi:outer membrane receptor for ferrienterochelin and colicin|nr:MAG: TonB-dependent receptor [Sphingobacteriales bacterium]
MFLANAQKGKISGKIIDGITQETLIGVNISIDQSSDGTITDFDGNYELELNEGIYTLIITYLGYETKKVGNIQVKADQTTPLNVAMSVGKNELAEVTIVDFKKTNTEATVLLELKNADQVSSGISAQQIQKSNDRDASQVVKRIPGVTIQGSFINIRGLNPRYNTVQLHNAMAPSVESDVKSFAFDIIPSAQLDRIIVQKSPSANIPGEFAGGMVKVFTKSFPDNNFVDVSYSTTVRVGTTFKPFYNQKNSGLFYLGYDNKNNLASNYPTDVRNVSLSSLRTVAESMNNDWNAYKMASIPDQRIGISFGRRMQSDKYLIGMITSINYSISKQSNEIFRADYDMYNFDGNKSQPKYNYIDKQYNNTVRLGVLHNWAFKIKNNTIEIKNLYNMNALSQYNNRTGENFSSGNTINNFALYNSYKGIYATQLMGKHQIKSEKNSIDWVLGYSRAYRKEPDFRRYTSTLNTGTNIFEINVLPNSTNPNQMGRFFSNMKENIITAGINSNHKFYKTMDKGIIPSISTGVYAEYKNRDFSARNIGFRKADFTLFNSEYTSQGIDYLLQHINTTDGILLSEQTRAFDSYKANNLIAAAYVNTELAIKNKFKIVAGARFEHSNQSLQSGSASENVNVNLVKNIILPSINLSYNITSKMLVRLAYGMSVNRPEFREIAPFAFDDFYTGYTIQGNPNLVNATVQNIDAKWEFYPSNAEVINVSVFYKKFSNPIETKAVVGTSGSTFSFANAKSSDVIGVELEIKKSFTNAKKYLFQHLGVMTNASYIYSKVDLGAESVGQSNNRPLQGQSPFSINSGLYFEDKELGLQASLLYNIIGKRIAFVGTDDNPDTYEMPRSLLDFNIRYRFKNNIELSFAANDLINAPILLIQDGNGDGKLKRNEDQIFQKYRTGQTFTFGIKYNF